MQDLTKGSIPGNVIKMSSFMLVSMVMQTLYFLIDLYFVGRLGPEAVAAVSVAGNLNFFVLAATQMINVGTTALISHATGRKDRDEAILVFNQSQVLSVVVGASFLVVMTGLRGPYVAALASDARTAALATDYLAWFIPALALQFAMVSSAAALRGTGNFKPGMVIQSATVLVNIVLAPVLIAGWGTGRPLGVGGAALATFVAVAGGVVALALYVLHAEKYLVFAWNKCRPRLTLWWRMVKIGLPAGAEFALMAVYMWIVFYVCRPFGPGAQAGFGVGLRVMQAGFLPVVALGFAVAPVAGQNFGARLPERVRETFRAGVAMATSLMVVFTVVCHAFPEAMVGFFADDPHTRAVGGEYLRIVSWNFIAAGVVFVSSSMFQAMGNTMPALISSALRLVLLGGPALVLSHTPGFQLRWIWYLSVAVVLIQMTCNLLFLRREFRVRLDFSPRPVTAAAE
jgi:putative MATE family efflux protein